MPRKVTTSPVAIWLAPRVSTMNACTSASSAPAAAPASAPSHDAARLDADDVGGERAGQHRALGAEVDHPGPLGERLADDREEDRGAAGDGAREDGFEHQTSFFWANPSTASRTSAISTLTAAPERPALIFRPKPPTKMAASAIDDTIAFSGSWRASHEARKAM